MRVFYLTHPEVVIDREVHVPQWGLNEIGAARVDAALARDWWQGVTHVRASDEVKAMETAAPFCAALGIPLATDPGLAEIDRSRAGFIPEPEFSAVAEACFANPDQSVHGWEPAGVAQRRCCAAVERALCGHKAGDLLLVGHGGVGAFLYAALVEREIGAVGTKPGGYGRVFAFDAGSRQIVGGWGAMEIGPTPLTS